MTRAIPTREASGEIRIATPAPPAIVAAFNEGRKFLSIEFHAVQETRSKLRALGKFNRLSFRAWRSFRRSRVHPGNRRSTQTRQKRSGVVMKWPWSRPEVRESYTDQVSRSNHGERKRGE